MFRWRTFWQLLKEQYRPQSVGKNWIVLVNGSQHPVHIRNCDPALVALAWVYRVMS